MALLGPFFLLNAAIFEASLNKNKMTKEKVEVKSKRQSRFFEQEFYVLIPRLSIYAYDQLFQFISLNALKIKEVKESSCHFWVNLGQGEQIANEAANFINENQ